MKCKRDSCPNIAARSGGNGLCHKHYNIGLRERRPLSGWEPAQGVAKDLARLRAAGFTFRRIAHLTGLTDEAVSRIARGKTTFVQAHHAELIRSLRSSDATDVGDPVSWVPVFGSARRLRGLCAMGFTQGFLAERLGVSRDCVDKIVKERGPLVRASTALRATELFNSLQVTPLDDPLLQTSAARKTRTLSAKRGWALPFAWDEDQIDNPDARAHRRRTLSDDWYQEYLDLKALGLNDGRVAERLGIDPSTLSRRLSRRCAA